jgi:plastocyanin
MSSRTLAALVVIFAILGGAYYIYAQQVHIAPPPSVAVEPPGKGVVGNPSITTDPFDTTITYTDEGFSPRDITIRAGERVRFLNKSSTAFWPASGVHPTHTLYPEKESTDCLGSSFDACQDLKSGEFFDYTFYYKGTWPYHDHLHGYDSGSITVN